MIATAFDATLPAAAALVVGLAFGAVYFAALRRSVAAGHGVRGRAARTVAAAVGRVVAAATFFAIAARFGASPLLASMIGFLIARTLAARAAQVAERLEASRS